MKRDRETQTQTRAFLNLRSWVVCLFSYKLNFLLFLERKNQTPNHPPPPPLPPSSLLTHSGRTTYTPTTPTAPSSLPPSPTPSLIGVKTLASPNAFTDSASSSVASISIPALSLPPSLTPTLPRSITFFDGLLVSGCCCWVEIKGEEGEE